MKKGDLGVWVSTDEFIDFCVKHRVYGAEANKLKKKMTIPEPTLKLRKIK